MEQPITPPANYYLTPAQVARYFNVDPKTVTRWAKAGRLNSMMTPGGHRRYLASEVQAMAQTRAEVERCPDCRYLVTAPAHALKCGPTVTPGPGVNPWNAPS